jgi:hypothetical protein
VFVPYEVYELAKSVSALKALAPVVNLAIVVYLLLAKRLLGLRGGGRAERAGRDQDTGWAALSSGRRRHHTVCPWRPRARPNDDKRRLARYLTGSPRRAHRRPGA